MKSKSKHSRDRKLLTVLFSGAGINIDGDSPCDIQVHDDRFFSYVVTHGVVGLGESYMFGWWDCRGIDQLIAQLLLHDIHKQAKSNLSFMLRLLLSKIINFQSPLRSYEVAKVHYDLGTDFYSMLLDERMNYSCGYWKNTNNLDQAQLDKLDLCCRKMGLQRGMKVLDIGCGWGSFARFAAERYGVEVTGVTVSRSQAEYARDYCAGLPVQIHFDDYRSIEGKFDRIASIGMFEHVGWNNYPVFMECVDNWLQNDGLFLLHTMGMNSAEHGVDEWVVKYIFPNAMLPTGAEILSSSAGVLRLEDWHNFGLDYHRTLWAWQKNLIKNWSRVVNLRDEQFARMFNYFLLYFAGGFLSSHIQLWQIVFSKKDSKSEYAAIR